MKYKAWFLLRLREGISSEYVQQDMFRCVLFVDEDRGGGYVKVPSLRIMLSIAKSWGSFLVGMVCFVIVIVFLCWGRISCKYVNFLQ